MMKHTDAMRVAQWIRQNTGKHCVDIRTTQTFADGYWQYYVASHDIKHNELTKLIAEARQALGITEA